MGNGKTPDDVLINADDELAMEDNHLNDMVRFLTKQGFPYVNILQGGYSAVHDFLVHSPTFHLTDLVDHTSTSCDFCDDVSSEGNNDDSFTSAYSSFSGALKDGKSWLKKKKDEVPTSAKTTKILSSGSQHIKGGTKWLMKKRDDFSDVKVRNMLH